MPADARQQLVNSQLARTETSFERALKALTWPKYRVHFAASAIELPESPVLQLHARIRQPLLICLVNRAFTAQTIRLQPSNVILDRHELRIDPGATRYLYVSAEADEPGGWTGSVRFSTAETSAELRLGAEVKPTAVLRGILECAESTDPPIARIRVTDEQGTYFPPEEQKSGLVRMIPYGNATKAERWTYADSEFRVRVPQGNIRISIRRGLEYFSADEVIDVDQNGELVKRFFLRRWSHMEREGWYPGDMHVHMLDPKTALFEMRAENLNMANVMVFKHLGETYARGHFTGGVDPISDSAHFVYYNEEFRNEPMGHIGLVNLKSIVEPMSTGRLGLHWPTVMRFDSLNMPLPLHGDATSPDYPLLVEVMRQAHRQGGFVD
jgi:hypothetical protein